MKLTDEEYLELTTILYKNEAMLEAILEDYARRMEKVDGLKRGTTIENIGLSSLVKMLENLKKRLEKTLPEKVAGLDEVKMDYIAAACRILNISFDNTATNSQKVLKEIDARYPEMSKALHEYFDAYSKYRSAFIDLKKDDLGAFFYYQIHVRIVSHRKEILDNILNRKPLIPLKP